MKLKKPNAPIIANLAMDFATIHSAEYADFLMKKGTPEQFDQIPVGTGSFSVRGLPEGCRHPLTRRFEGWAGKPKVDDLIYAITPDATARYAKLKANECQVMIAPNPADLDAMGKDADVNLHVPGRPQHRLPGDERARSRPSTSWKCARPSPWRSTAMPS